MALTATSIFAAETQDVREEKWIDRAHDFVYDRLWRSTMSLDHYFGSRADENVYREVYGSIAPSLLWDQFRGFQPHVRFQINAPLPGLDDRVHAVLGEFNPDEFITERAQSSGSLRRQFGTVRDDQTILGLVYRARRRENDGFGFGLGVRVRTPLDPYVKGDYTIARGTPRTFLFTYKQTLFWQQSEHAGTTSRFDVDHFLSEKELLRLTVSGTLSQKTSGMRGFAAATLLRSLTQRRAITGNLSIDWESRAPVPLHDFGAVLAYRQSISREWLILELRTSLNWPKEILSAPRTMSWGLGVGVEMLFGTTQFQARPVTF
jgi:hypothetical protein